MFATETHNKYRDIHKVQELTTDIPMAKIM